MMGALDSVAREIEDECRHLHGRYLASAASLEEVCKRIASDVVPHLQAPPVRRALKMGLPRRTSKAAAGGRR